LISAFVCLYKVGVDFPVVRFPMWLVVGVISRDMILLIGSVVVRLVQGSLEIDPTMSGKATTFLEGVCVAAMLLQFQQVSILWIITMIFAMYSCMDYLRRGLKIIHVIPG
jgi:phosphatidylglycerophosphate synthase